MTARETHYILFKSSAPPPLHQPGPRHMAVRENHYLVQTPLAAFPLHRPRPRHMAARETHHLVQHLGDASSLLTWARYVSGRETHYCVRHSGHTLFLLSFGHAVWLAAKHTHTLSRTTPSTALLLYRLGPRYTVGRETHHLVPNTSATLATLPTRATLRGWLRNVLYCRDTSAALPVGQLGPRYVAVHEP